MIWRHAKMVMEDECYGKREAKREVAFLEEIPA